MSLPIGAMKRKADDLEDSSDEEEPMLGRQVLPVANLPDTFDGVPMDGFQYLFTVRRDARLLPHVTRVANPYELPDAPPPDVAATSGAGTGSVGEPSKGDVLPSEEWRETFLRRFKNFRKNSVQPTIHIHIPDSSAKLMPDKKERDLWWAFLAGRPESEWNPPKKPKQPKPSRWQQRNQKRQPMSLQEAQEDTPLPYDMGETCLADSVPEVSVPSTATLPSSVGMTGQVGIDEPLQPPSATSDPAIKTSASVEDGEIPLIYTPREPTPALLQHIDHRYAMHLLMYFGHWINTRVEEGHLPYTDITEAHARWIFALLSRVDDWISGDETSLLRNLARGCLELMVERRKRPVAEESPEEPPAIDERSFWLIVTVIIGIWGQTDLWTDAESMLSKVEAGTV
ncbi:hypothetical protein BD311DRAFT_703794 [Dichomitus squalens]|uniref:Survival motor neuron interacting protein 1-domain-containing protein n=1 Tax=Dichomitus squalens TaxID=114155 RepID=A0A4Q9M8V7_9APHY|nr:hypothetical protein BD311DRAFT_703794 [Dichomitus squalens]